MLALGIPTMKGLFAACDETDLLFWQGYDLVCGLPDSRWEMGMLASSNAYFSGNAKRWLDPEEFMGVEVVKEIDLDSMKSKLMGLTRGKNQCLAG